MNSLRVASLVFVVALVCSPRPAQAQGGGGSAANLTARVKALEAALAALDGRVGKLEGNITATDLIGTYAVVWIDIPLSAANSGAGVPATIQTDGVTGTLILNEGGTASLQIAGCSTVLTQGSWALTYGCGSDTPPVGTWSYNEATGILTTDIGQYDGEFFVGLGGRLLTTAFSVFHDEPTADSSNTEIVVASRLR